MAATGLDQAPGVPRFATVHTPAILDAATACLPGDTMPRCAVLVRAWDFVHRLATA